MFVKLIKIGIFMNQESFVYKKFYDYAEHLCQMLHSIGINNFTDKKYVELALGGTIVSTNNKPQTG